MAQAPLLRSSLIDMVVAVGLSEQTGLRPERVQSDSQSPPHSPLETRPLFSTAFAPDVLAGISANVAHFPFNKTKQDIHYPPNFGKNKVKISREGRVRSVGSTIKKTSTHSLQRILRRTKTEEEAVDCNGTAETGQEDCVDNADYEGHLLPHPPSTPAPDQTPSLHRRTTFRNRSFRPADFARKNSQTDKMEMKPTDLPLDLSQLQSLVTLCFPDGGYVRESSPPNTLLYLVLTDLQGTKSYAVSLVYNLPYTATWNEEEGCGNLCIPQGAGSGVGEEGVRCYAPIAVVLVSKSPYLMLLRDCASSIVLRLQQGGADELQQILKESALHLCSISVPSPGSLGIEFTFNQCQMFVPPAPFPGQAVVNIQANLLFQYLSREVILKVIGCLLVQQSIVFLAGNYALLTTVIQTFLQLLHPFVWEWTYVPVLPYGLLELLEAPGTFIMGCHRDHKKHIQEIDTIVLVDIERGELERCSPMFIPALPQEPVDSLNATLKDLQPNFETWKMSRSTTFSFEAYKAEEMEFYKSFNQKVFPAFLQLMVDLFRGVLPHIKPEKHFFNRDKFLESVPQIDATFYEQVLNTDMFSTFVKRLLAQKNDAWSALEEKTRPVAFKRQSVYSTLSLDFSRPLSTEIDPMLLSRSLSSPDLDLLLTRSNVDVTYYSLPNFVYALNHVYFDQCVNDIKTHVKVQTQSDQLKQAGYLFLLAQYKAAAGHKFDALETFQALGELQPSLCPFSDVADIIAGLSESEQESLQEKEFYRRRSDIWGQVREKQSHQTTVIMAFDRLPKGDMDLASFSEMVQVLDITKNHDAIRCLFQALVLDQALVVSACVFEEFYRSWKEVEMQCRDIRLPVSPDVTEYVLKMSDTIKCSYGMGRIGLTQHRLFFLREGSKKLKDIVMLVDMKSIEKIEQKSILTGPSKTLRITSKDERKFQASLREERDLWHVCVREMWAGQCDAVDGGHYDSVDLAAHNVLLLEAYARCLDSDEVTSFLDLSKGAELICSYLSQRERGSLRRVASSTPSFTPSSPQLHDPLHHRVDPSAKTPGDRHSVLALLYTTGNRCSGSLSDRSPRLWCGLGGLKAGRLVVMDAVRWDAPTVVVNAQDRVVCLLAVGKSMVWAGSFDRNIYVIDTATLKCIRTLSQHKHHITGLTKTEFESTVYSCSLNGDIIQWCTTSFNCLKTFSLPNTSDLRLLQFEYKLLWCGTRREIVVFTGEKELGKLSYEDDLVDQETQATEKFELDCFLITPYKEVWVGCRTRGIILIFDAEDWKLKDNAGITCKGISTMICLKQQVWVGTKDGTLLILDQLTRKLLKSIHAHDDSIRSMCLASERHVLTGAGSMDGTVAIWNTACWTRQSVKER